MLEDHWFWRGFQSAVFLYVSCGPCFAAQTQRRRKKEAKRDKKRNAELAHQHLHDGHHPQPAPFEINPHWAEEIGLGPGPPKRRGRTRGAAPEKRDITTAGTNSTAASSLELGRVPSTGPEAKGQYWNSRRYQRADEEYTHFPPVPEHEAAPATAGQDVDVPRALPGASGCASTGARDIQKPKKSYYIPARAPPVSDLHPPATSTVSARRSERAWMTAPPPSVAFMEGRKQVTNRPRSATARSGGSVKAGLDVGSATRGIGKQMGQKVIEGRADRVDVTSETGRRLSLRGASHSRTDSRSPLRGSTSVDKDRATSRKARRRPAPLSFSSGSSAEEQASVAYSNEPLARASSAVSSRTAITRQEATYIPLRLKQHKIRPPMLITRSSDSTARIPMNNETENAGPDPSPAISLQFPDSMHTLSTTPSPLPTDNGQNLSSRKRKDTKTEDGPPYVIVKDSSLHILQDLVEPSALLNSKWIRTPAVEAKIPLPRERDDSLTDEWLSNHEAPQLRQSCDF
jgi:hypothetical protein